MRKEAKEKIKKQVQRWKHPGGKLRRLGPASCSEAELLAIVIGHGSRSNPADEIALEIIDKYKNIGGLMGVSLEELMKIRGIKAVKATQIAAFFELTRRIIKHIEKEQ